MIRRSPVAPRQESRTSPILARFKNWLSAIPVHLAVTPDKLCLGVVGSEFFDRASESLGKSHERRTLPIETLDDILRLLTQPGGDNNRATETPPGPQPLWIGLRRMTDFATAWLVFGPQD